MLQIQLSNSNFFIPACVSWVFCIKFQIWLKIPNGLYVSLPRIKEILLPSADFYIYSTLMGKSGDIQALDTTESFNLQVMAKVKTETAKIPNENPFKTNKFYIDQVSTIDQPLLKSIAVATISQIKQCNYCRAVGQVVTVCPDAMPSSKC
ncbi:unnamed protein product [Ambrosiozyma monospora]|uniref:Unnamed protein product n=1 Tax=Ambrosiozyma monospora TaxID=43982 RepID=A0A9W7DJD5_AMBMO|nr:unnamed protein product [Ambrosiozyma monospora]